MLLYQKFGISRANVDPGTQVWAVDFDEKYTAKRNQNLPHHLSGLASNLIGAAVRFYLIGDFTSARNYGSRVASAAIDYLFGDWRLLVKTDLDTIDPEWWHEKDYWMFHFSGSLMWGTTLGNWDAVRTIADYPDNRRKLDPDDGTPALRQFYIEIARFLRGEDITGAIGRINRARGGNIRGTIALARALEAVTAKNELAANEAINDFFARRHKRQMSKRITDSISMDGTTIVNIARREGISIQLNPKYELYYLSLPS